MSAENRMVKRDAPYDLCDIKIRDASKEELSQISEALSLGLSDDEMLEIQKFYVRENREATDVELQSLGQAWSEHCCYKSSKSTLKEFVFGIDRDDVLSRGDAGVMVFDDDYGYALRVESHNHPSAIEPYGGAATGIGGIVRDVICMGAQPIGLADPLCFGPIDTKKEIPAGIKHPRYLINGVVSGIRDYGNRIGIPTITGGFFFDDSYTGNCLVNVCCFGIVKRKDLLRNYASGPGEIMILFGGRTGRDGIHGVNFASKDITATSEDDSRGAVQLGDPITKEPVIHACLELAQKHLVTGMKDLGGGGLSCVVGEMAIELGCGADVDLDKVPLKETGLAPWEIWVSESQERMMCTVKPENVDKVMAIFDLWDIIATPVAKTTDTGRTRLFWGGEKIFDMDIEFLTGGPVYNRPYTAPKVSSKKDEVFPEVPSVSDAVLTLLSDLNVASKEWAIRQYDHQVRAGTVLNPMVGELNETGPGDATVLMPVPGRWKGLAAAVGCNPWFTGADPYRGGKVCIDEAFRNVVAVGARPNAFTDCLNFGNPEKPERLGEFREAVRGIGEIAKELNIPIPSGNVSMYNEAPGGEHILPTPMIVCCGLIDDVRKSVSADFKKSGSCIFVVGDTKDEMGASLLFRKYGGKGGDVPDVVIPRLKEVSGRLLEAMGEGLVLGCHDCSDGGLGIAVSEMCISGQVGAQLNLSQMPGDDIMVKLFSESASRWIAEVDGADVDRFTQIMGDAATLIGITKGDELVIEGTDARILVQEMRAAWNDPIWKIMGGGAQ
ncbi:phosphoribosylformylglycinamidine synthase II [Thermoplasmatales archaeon BRNA1]|nr:phosphoribosylformylglycinamidine synthase II [Thermoplasmatales archaeon BRNA1]